MNIVYFKILRVVRSRYGMVERVDEERRRCTDEELDCVIAQFRSRYDIIEVRVVKL